MNAIVKNIEKLLGRYDYVIIPDFGGFVIQFQSAHFTENQIIPPYSTISFNPLLKQTDGLLAIEISRSKELEYRDAVELITNEVSLFKEELEAKKQLKLGRLGTFSLDKENKIVFTPNSQLSFIPQNYGLKSLSNTIRLETEEKSSSKMTITFNLPNRKRTMKYVALLILIVTMGMLIPQTTMYQKSKATFNLFEPIETFLDYENLPSQKVDLYPLTLPISKTTLSAKKQQIVVSKQKPIAVSQPVIHKFQIIIASVSSKNYAYKLKRMYSKNLKNVKIIKADNYYRISAMEFNNIDEAHQFIKNLKKNQPQFQSAWIYKQ